MNDNAASFFGGFILSFFGNAKWVASLNLVLGGVFGGIPYTDIATEWALKVVSTLILGIIGGLAGLIAKDIYRIIKKKKSGNDTSADSD